MTDLRDTMFPPEATSPEGVFLEYHQHSPYAVAKVEAGLRLNPEMLDYMRRELAERARAKAEYERKLKEEMELGNAQQSTETAASKPVGERGAGPDPVLRTEHTAEENS